MNVSHTWALALAATVALHDAGSARAGETYYLSASGSDENNGTAAATPFATLAKVNAVLRAGDAVRLKRGDVFFGTFRPKVPGTAEAPITVGAYGDAKERPIITGFKAVTDWKPTGKAGLYEAVMDPAPAGLLEMVRFDGKIRPKGRLPKAGKGWEQDPAKPGAVADSWFQITAHVKNSQVTTKDPVPDVIGGEIVQKKYQWIIDRGRITAMSRADGQTTLAYHDGSQYDAWDKHGFFVQNHINCLTEPGDWCYDEATRKLTMHFGTQAPSAHAVQAACLDNLAELTDCCRIKFDGIAFTGSNGDLVKLDARAAERAHGTPGAAGVNGCDHVSLNDCALSFAGRNGISVTAHATNNSYIGTSGHGSVTGCTISDINNNGIDVRQNPGWSIVGNTLLRIALHEGLQQNSDGQGIGIHRPGDLSLVQFNDVSHVAYIGIYFDGDGTQIRNNHVHHFCMLKSDGGGIYTYGGGDINGRRKWPRPRVVDGNIVHDGVGGHEGVFTQQPGNPYVAQAQGIYIDSNATDVVITNNTVFRCASNGLFAGSTARITAHRNTLADNHTAQLALIDTEGQPVGLDFRDNLCFAFEREQLCLSVGLNRPEKGRSPAEYVAGIGTFANNLYARPVHQPDNIDTNGYAHAGSNRLKHDPDKSRQDYGAFADYTGGGVVSIAWAGRYLSLDKWQSVWGQDKGTKKTPRGVASINELRLEYNPTNAAVVKMLPGTFEDAFGAVHSESITLKPYASAVLMKIK